MATIWEVSKVYMRGKHVAIASKKKKEKLQEIKEVTEYSESG